MSTVMEPRFRFTMTYTLWVLLGLAAAMTLFVFWEPVARLMKNWLTRPEYSHGIVIPAVSLYLIWQRRAQLRETSFAGSWVGVAVVLLGTALWLVGELSAIYAVTQFALVVVIGGIGLSLVGARGFRPLYIPVLLLLLMIPLPRFLYENFSSQLQLVSSELGVAMLRLFGVSVFLEGNVIDLGHFQMQVVEACDGLRYLFPMMALALVIAYFYRGAVWEKCLIFLASIPITIVMNSFRIAMIGLFAEFGNTALAEGVLHDMQGWVLFMLSTGAVLLILRLLSLRRPDINGFPDAFDFGAIPAEDSSASAADAVPRNTPTSFIIAIAIVALSAGATITMPARAGVAPDREFCFLFPMQFGPWSGQRETMETIFFDKLELDDYVLANYTGDDGVPVNFYLAYYDSQRKGESVHSPRACLPGGGWRVESFGTRYLDPATRARPVNRAVISKGDQSQVVYYWFKQRDRWLTNEYAVKWYLLVDSLLRNRTDGALIRAVTPVVADGDLTAADARLNTFAKQVDEQLPCFVPD